MPKLNIVDLPARERVETYNTGFTRMYDVEWTHQDLLSPVISI
jgi:hypothetical protein